MNIEKILTVLWYAPTLLLQFERIVQFNVIIEKYNSLNITVSQNQNKKRIFSKLFFSCKVIIDRYWFDVSRKGARYIYKPDATNVFPDSASDSGGDATTSEMFSGHVMY